MVEPPICQNYAQVKLDQESSRIGVKIQKYLKPPPGPSHGGLVERCCGKNHGPPNYPHQKTTPTRNKGLIKALFLVLVVLMGVISWEGHEQKLKFLVFFFTKGSRMVELR